MPNFCLRGPDRRRRAVTGEIEAHRRAGRIQRLQDTGLIPIGGAGGQRAAVTGGRAGVTGGGASAAQLTAATRELATLVGAGTTIESALEMVAEDDGQP